MLESAPTQIDWSRRLRLADQNRVLEIRNTDQPARVTVGVPTFNRPETLRRTLASLARQSFREFVVLISDNAGESQDTIDAIQAFADDLPEVHLVAQKTNIGALPSMNMLLSCAETDYFMWLADDDEVSGNYLERLVGLLDADPGASSAMGGFRMMQNAQDFTDVEQPDTASPGRARRLFRFVALETNDSFFYGLHRTSNLRRCRFTDFFYPNKGMLTSWCYLFIFDLLWQGPIHCARDAAWICHNYSDKQYVRARANGIGDRIKTLLRLLNVYLLYCGKAARRNPLYLAVVLPASILGYASEVAAFFVRRLSGNPTKRKLI